MSTNEPKGVRPAGRVKGGADVDWESIKTKYLESVPLRRIAEEEGISTSAIRHRASKHKWKEEAAGLLTSRSICVPTGDVPKAGARTKLTDPMREQIAELKAKGASKASIAGVMDIRSETLSRWMETDDKLSVMLTEARYEAARGYLNTIHEAAQKGDWKAAQAMLKTMDDTKEQFSDARESNGMAVRVIMFDNMDEQPKVAVDVKE